MKLRSFLIVTLLIAKVTVIAQSSQPSSDRRLNVAILIFPGVTVIDFAGPFEVFHMAGMRVYTVGEKIEPVTLSGRLIVTPNYTVENCPEPDVIVIPAGEFSSVTDSSGIMNWLRQAAEQAEITMSVCLGADILAQAGLLNGLKATTYAPHIGHLQHSTPKAKIVSDQRVVDNGKIITTGGLSAGIDGALHVVERLFGRGRANEVAVNMEYNWNPLSDYVRPQLADMKLLFVLDEVLHPRLKKRTLIYQGDRRHWQFAYEVEAKQTLENFKQQFFSIMSDWGWTKQSENGNQSNWSYTDEQNHSWECSMNLEELKNQAGWVNLAAEVNLVN
jgi:putative intracellular protease/amidase